MEQTIVAVSWLLGLVFQCFLDNSTGQRKERESVPDASWDSCVRGACVLLLSLSAAEPADVLHGGSFLWNDNPT